MIGMSFGSLFRRIYVRKLSAIGGNLAITDLHVANVFLGLVTASSLSCKNLLGNRYTPR